MQRHADDRVRAISLAMGMVPIIWTTTPSSGPFDTNGKWAVASFARHGRCLILFDRLESGWRISQFDDII